MNGMTSENQQDIVPMDQDNELQGNTTVSLSSATEEQKLTYLSSNDQQQQEQQNSMSADEHNNDNSNQAVNQQKLTQQQKEDEQDEIQRKQEEEAVVVFEKDLEDAKDSMDEDTKILTEVDLAAKEKMDSNLSSLPPRAYLDATVTPVLLEALKHVAQERPANPLEYLGMYLVKNANAIKSAAATSSNNTATVNATN